MLLHHGVRHPDDPRPCPEAPKLRKATLDLMSLDASDASGHPPGSWQKSPPQSKQLYPYPVQGDRGVSSDQSSLLIENVRQIYPPHSSSSSSPPPEGTNFPGSATPYPSTPSDMLRSSNDRLTTRSSSKRSFDTVSSPASVQPQASTSYPSTTQRAKRSRQSPVPLQRASDPSQSSTSSSSSLQLAQAQEDTSPSSRSQLLSASQKRANHIQSEQKRRANIRRGYEALCDTVPALREAIRKEEEEATGILTNSGGGSSRNATRKKKAKNTNDDGEKIDGRAGPRSENIVLQKTIDYIQELNATKEDLLRRLAQARSVLPSDHPLLTPQCVAGETAPLWEREWNYSPDADDEGSEDEVC